MYSYYRSALNSTNGSHVIANKKELVTDLVVKAKQVEYLIQSLPEPEAEEIQVRLVLSNPYSHNHIIVDIRLQGCRSCKMK